MNDDDLDPDELTRNAYLELTTGPTTTPPATPRPPVNRSLGACWWCGHPAPKDRLHCRPAYRSAWLRHWTVPPRRSAVDCPDQPPPDVARRIADRLERTNNQEDTT